MATAAIQSLIVVGLMIMIALVISVSIEAWRNRRRRNRYRKPAKFTPPLNTDLVNMLRDSGQL